MAVTREGYVFMQYGFDNQAVYRYNINTPTVAAVKTTNSGCGFTVDGSMLTDGALVSGHSRLRALTAGRFTQRD